MEKFKGTTIILVEKNGRVAIGGDGQVTLGNTIIKGSARKIRKVANGKVLVGFAGSTADAFALMERFEKKLSEFRGNIERATVELAKEWRTDKRLRHLEAMMIVTDGEKSFLISGVGDIIGPENGIIAIGSGAPYAQAAAYALKNHTKLSAKEIVEESLKIASSICIYTNNNFTIEEVGKEE